MGTVFVGENGPMPTFYYLAYSLGWPWSSLQWGQERSALGKISVWRQSWTGPHFPSSWGGVWGTWGECPREPGWPGGCRSSYTPRFLNCQTIQALDDMLQALVMEDTDPNMPTLQNFLEVSGYRKQSDWSPILNLSFWEERQGILR